MILTLLYEIKLLKLKTFIIFIDQLMNRLYIITLFTLKKLNPPKTQNVKTLKYFVFIYQIISRYNISVSFFTRDLY